MATTVTSEIISLGDTRARRTLRRIQAFRGISNKELGQLIGWGTSKVQSYTGGPTKLTPGVMELFARHLNVEAWVLNLDENSAMEWVARERPNPTTPTEGGAVIDISRQGAISGQKQHGEAWPLNELVLLPTG